MLSPHPGILTISIPAWQLLNIVKKRWFFDLPITNIGNFLHVVVAATIPVSLTLHFSPPEHLLASRKFCSADIGEISRAHLH